MRAITAIVTTGLILAANAGAEPAVGVEDVQGPFTWGGVDNVTRLGNLYFAGQPDEEALAAARTHGVEVVVDLRHPSERDWDERAAVEGLGLTYYNVPVTGDAFDPAAFAKIDALVAEHAGQPILVHCSSSNRVGGWLAGHLVTEQGLAPDRALEVGRKTGITKDAIESRLHVYLARQALAPFKEELQTALRDGLARGPTEAIDACAVEAPRIADAASAPGLRVGRTSHRLRNPANAPAPWMEPLLAEFASRDPEPGAFALVEREGGGAGYVEPITVQPLCLTCHGDAVAPELVEKIRARYPEDAATGFEVGDFRGLFWAEIDSGAGS